MDEVGRASGRRDGLKLVLRVAFLVLLARGAAASCAISFDSAPLFPAGNGITALHAANINGDGYRDLVGISDGGVAVMLGGPHATFGGMAVSDAAGHYTQLAVTDLDHDGDDDVIVFDGSQAVVYRNDRGVLTRAGAVPVPDRSAVLVAGDFNGDGKGDFAYLSASTKSLVVEYGNGDFTFTPASLPFPTTLSGRLLVADLNRDGADDIVVTNFNAYIYFGSSSGALPVTALNLTADTAVVGDFDGDGQPDLALSIGTRLNFMMNAGAGTGAKIVGPIDGALYHSPEAAADLDGDGIDDLIVGGPGSLQIIGVKRNALYNNGFFLTNSTRTGFVNASVPALAADLDGDGQPEIVADNGTTVGVYKSNGHGGLRAPRYVLDSFSSTPMAAGDFNNDGLDDYVDQFGVYFSNGDGTFRLGAGPALNAIGMAVGDVNGDGKLDVVFLKAGVTSKLVVATALGTGDGLRLAGELPLDPWVLNTTYSTDPFAGPALADINGDGKLDFLVVLDGAPGSYQVGGVFAAIGNGDGTFGPLLRLNTDATFLNRTQPGDANRDGKVDLMTGGHLSMNLGSGQFAPSTLVDGCSNWPSLFVDVNRDGVPDCVSGFGSMSVAIGRGDGTFQPPRDLGLTQLGVTSLVVRDLNHDGCVDLLAIGPASFADHVLAGFVITGDCHGNFTHPTPIFPTGYPVLTGDFNGDGVMDLLDGGFLRLGTCTEIPEASLHRAVRH